MVTSQVFVEKSHYLQTIDKSSFFLCQGDEKVF